MANIGGRLEIERTHAIVSNTVISWLEKKMQFRYLRVSVAFLRNGCSVLLSSSKGQQPYILGWCGLFP